MTKKYLVKIKGEFEETQAVVANNEDEAKEKAKKRLGETIDLKATGNLEIVGTKEFGGDQ